MNVYFLAKERADKYASYSYGTEKKRIKERTREITFKGEQRGEKSGKHADQEAKGRPCRRKWSMGTDVPGKSEKERSEKQLVDVTTRMTF